MRSQLLNISTAEWYFMCKLTLKICTDLCVVQNMSEKLQNYWTLKMLTVREGTLMCGPLLYMAFLVGFFKLQNLMTKIFANFF